MHLPDPEVLVGVDASRMAGRVRTGTENYANQIIRHLLKEDVQWRWRLYFNGNAGEADLPPDPHVEIRDIPGRRLWTHLRLSAEVTASAPDLLFVPSHVIPLRHPASVVTIHDLGYLHVPEAHPTSQRRMLDLTTKWSARVAKHIIVPSERTRDDLVQAYGTPASKITVIHHGVDDRFADLAETPDASFRGRYDLHRPYVLAVGTIQPRKNLPLLAEAMAASALDHDLVIAGKRGWLADDVLAKLQASGLRDRLRILDYVPDHDLPALYAHAEMFVQPSNFEGFGMPVLEAMASGTPVITTDGSSLAEIGGEAALRFPANDAPALRSAIEQLVGSQPERENRVAAGRAWAREFSWERAARKTRNVLYDQLIAGTEHVPTDVKRRAD